MTGSRVFIGAWCNGNTSVFGAEFLRSNRSVPTTEVTQSKFIKI